jgi:hypothetical protein
MKNRKQEKTKRVKVILPLRFIRRTAWVWTLDLQDSITLTRDSTRTPSGLTVVLTQGMYVLTPSTLRSRGFDDGAVVDIIVVELEDDCRPVWGDKRFILLALRGLCDTANMPCGVILVAVMGAGTGTGVGAPSPFIPIPFSISCPATTQSPLPSPLASPSTEIAAAAAAI